MKGIRPCPYCGGEVEVVKLIQRPGEPKPVYRIQCIQCKALVARGDHFPKDTPQEAEERIQQYNQFVETQMAPIHMQRIRQTVEAKRRDRKKDYGYSEE